MRIKCAKREPPGTEKLRWPECAAFRPPRNRPAKLSQPVATVAGSQQGLAALLTD